MNNLNEFFELAEDLELTVHPRESEMLSIPIPKDMLESLTQVGAQRDMPMEAFSSFISVKVYAKI